MPDEVVFQDFARVCQHVRKIPTDKELRIAQRELGTKTHTAYKVLPARSQALRRRVSRNWLRFMDGMLMRRILVSRLWSGSTYIMVRRRDGINMGGRPRP